MVNIRNFTDIPNALDSAASGTFLYKTASGVEFQTLEYTDITDYPSTGLDSAAVLSIIDSNYVRQKLNVGSNAFNVLNYADSGVSSNVTKDSGGSTVKIGNYSKGIGNTYLDSSSIVTIGSHSFSLSNGVITFSGGTASSTFGVISITYLIVGGGGGGGSGWAGGGGGGGAGGVISGSADLSAGTYSITVGAAGTGADASAEDAGNDGGSSSFNSLTAGGGGGGGGFSALSTYAAGSNGSATNGSGGGGMWNASYQSGGTGDGTGNAGGNGYQGASYEDRAGGGGGGSGGAGSNGYASGNDEIGGDGGAGTLSSITGSSVSYAAGGGGGARGSATTSSGGTGGGAGGSSDTAATDATTAGSGGGGGAGQTSDPNADGGDGAAGVVIISSSTAASSTTGTVSTSTVGSNYVYQFTSDGSITF